MGISKSKLNVYLNHNEIIEICKDNEELIEKVFNKHKNVNGVNILIILVFK